MSRSTHSIAAKKAWKTRRNKPIAASDVIEAILGNNSTATNLLNRYVQNQVTQGKQEKQVRAAIKAHVTRRQNSV